MTTNIYNPSKDMGTKMIAQIQGAESEVSKYRNSKSNDNYGVSTLGAFDDVIGTLMPWLDAGWDTYFDGQSKVAWQQLVQAITDLNSYVGASLEGWENGLDNNINNLPSFSVYDDPDA